MDRALDPSLLSGALGDLENLPTPEELRRMLADAEVTAFFQTRGSLSPELVQTAWILHQVGTTSRALGLYGAERQVQANAVAAHIFDLALRDPGPPGYRLVLTFAAQVSSIRGDRMPNATALGSRLPTPSAVLIRQPGQASLELGCVLLTMRRGPTMAYLRLLGSEVRHEQRRREPESVYESGLAAAAGVVEGAWALQRFLDTGDEEQRQQALELFRQASNPESAARDLDSRWVAAHLADLTEDLGTASVWSMLPQGTPPAVGTAMTRGDPPVMALWPPQVALLKTASSNPLNPDLKRAVITFPTSAGKTLLMQMAVAHHVATQNSRVCVVAPTHSLCREIRRGLDGRLWLLSRTIVEDQEAIGQDERAAAVVMTPEQLAVRLRADEDACLSEFGLFVIDEAHLIKDPGRGWTLETTISRLHQLTRDTEHRLILVSAALGGTASVLQWISATTPPELAVSTWRGPRRLHATYTFHEGNRRTVAPTGKQRHPRRRSDLFGLVSLYADGASAIAKGTAELGPVTRYGKGNVEQPSVAERLKPLVTHAAAAGAVLTVHSSKRSAESLARTLSADRPSRDEASPLVRLAELRMGAGHPLVGVLDKGIAYHHAALPVDIQAEIEDALRGGVIDVVCATTTLTEGVNLPVRTVVICERGFFDGEAFQLTVDEAALLNAAGRAGRAGRETAGWVILVGQRGGPAPLQAIRALDEPQQVTSVMASDEALRALDEYERLVAETAGVLLEDVPPQVDGFLAYCWYLADSANIVHASEVPASVIAGVQSTLLWHQLPQPLRQRWEALAVRVVATYEETDPRRRRRWARSGARLSANALLEQVAQGAAEASRALNSVECSQPHAVASALLGEGRLEQLLAMLEERDRRFKRRRGGRVEVLNVDTQGLVLDWLGGADLAVLAARYLADVTGSDAGDAEAFRFEQLSNFLAKVCEHHLPWTLSTILEWIEEDTGLELCADLPSLLRLGVDTSQALSLMLSGVRSRRLANTVGREAASSEVSPIELRGWIAELDVAEWRRRFDTTPTEVADLLQFAGNPDAALSRRLLDGLAVEAPCTATGEGQESDLHLQILDDREPPHPVGAVSEEGVLVAILGAAAQHEIVRLLESGYRLTADLIADAETPHLSVRMEDDA